MDGALKCLNRLRKRRRRNGMIQRAFAFEVKVKRRERR